MRELKSSGNAPVWERDLGPGCRSPLAAAQITSRTSRSHQHAGLVQGSIPLGGEAEHLAQHVLGVLLPRSSTCKPSSPRSARVLPCRRPRWSVKTG